MIGLSLSTSLGSSVGAAVSPTTPADYVVTSDAEWATVHALSTATLEGKIIGFSGTNFSRITVSGHNFTTAPILRSENASSSIPAVELNGIGDITFDGLIIQGTGWPYTYADLLTFSGNVGDLLIQNSTLRHGYGSSLVNANPSTQYSEYTREDNVHTATTTSATYALTWNDAAMTGGWVEFFNRDLTNSAYAVFGGSGVTATTLDTEIPANTKVRFTGLNPTTDTHVAIITAAGTAECNARAEIGLKYYQSDFAASGGGLTAASITLLNNTFTDLNNGIKGFPSITGDAIAFGNTLLRIYQDIVSGFQGGNETHVLNNTYELPYARSGIAEALNGDAGDPHGDDFQTFGPGTATITDIYYAGNIPLYTARRTGVENQGEFISDNNFSPSYASYYSVGNIHPGGAPNGITPGEASYPVKDIYIMGNIVVNYGDVTSNSNIQTYTAANETTYIGNSFYTGASELGSGAQTIENSADGTDATNLATYFPNVTDWTTATTRAEVLAAWSSSGGAVSNVGPDAVSANAINYSASVYTDVIDWAYLPSGAAWNDLADVATSTVQTLDKRKIMNPATGQTVVPGTGVEWQSYLSDGTTVDTAWTTSSGTIDGGQYIQIRKTSSSSELTTVAASITINGIATSTDITTGLVLTDAFDPNGAYWTDTVNVASSTTVIEWEAKLQLPTISAVAYPFQVISDVITSWNASGDISYSVEDGNSTLLESGSTGVNVTTGVPIILNAKMDFDTLTYTLSLNGSVVFTTSIPDGDPYNYFQTTRKISFGTATQNIPSGSSIEYLKVWTTTSASRTLHKEISVAALGSIANINADGWITGTVV